MSERQDAGPLRGGGEEGAVNKPDLRRQPATDRRALTHRKAKGRLGMYLRVTESLWRVLGRGEVIWFML